MKNLIHLVAAFCFVASLSVAPPAVAQDATSGAEYHLNEGLSAFVAAELPTAYSGVYQPSYDVAVTPMPVFGTALSADVTRTLIYGVNYGVNTALPVMELRQQGNQVSIYSYSQGVRNPIPDYRSFIYRE